MDTYYGGNTGDLYNNAGNYGVTTPISTVRRNPDGFAIPPKTGPVRIPSDDPWEERIREPWKGDKGVPSVEELISSPRGTLTNPNPLPLVPPPVRPRVTPLPSGDPSIETIPFSPSDEVVVPPPATFPVIQDADPPITLEELRRLDPSVKDLQIISIEDAGVDTVMR
jgi:hypothetical protein